jgi:hypothetical protein
MAVAYKCDVCGVLTNKKDQISQVSFISMGKTLQSYDVCGKCMGRVRSGILKLKVETEKKAAPDSPEGTSVAEGRL